MSVIATCCSQKLCIGLYGFRNKALITEEVLSHLRSMVIQLAEISQQSPRGGERQEKENYATTARWWYCSFTPSEMSVKVRISLTNVDGFCLLRTIVETVDCFWGFFSPTEDSTGINTYYFKVGDRI